MSFVTSLTQQLPATSQHTGLSSASMYPGSQMNPQSYMSRVPSLPENVYGNMYSSGSRPDTAGYYPVKTSGESLKAPSSLGQHYYVDHMMNPHPYSSLYPFDINAVRRKNATRETTGPLKAWLKQHKQNPYPTKGDKVMLAIATRMTLTQVSTWFANARRRMKKDKFDDEEDDKEETADLNDDKKRERSGSVSSRASSSEGNTSKELSDLSDAEDHLNVRTRPAKKCVQRLFSPDVRHDHVIDQSSSPESLPERPQSVDTAFCESRLPAMSDVLGNVSGNIQRLPITNLPPQKPKIWSISEIIGSANKTVSEEFSNYNTNTCIPTFTANTLNYSQYTSDFYPTSLAAYVYQDQNQVYPKHEFVNSHEVCPKETIQYL